MDVRLNERDWRAIRSALEFYIDDRDPFFDRAWNWAGLQGIDYRNALKKVDVAGRSAEVADGR